MRILLVHGRNDYASGLAEYLRQRGLNVRLSDYSEGILSQLRTAEPSLLLLELQSGEQDGFEIARQVFYSPEYSGIPLIFLADLPDETDEVIALELGAQDYIPRTMSPSLIYARIRNIIRKYPQRAKVPAIQDKAAEAGISFNHSNLSIKAAGRQIRLTLKEFAILHLLICNSGTIFSRQAIIDMIWSRKSLENPRVVDVHISGLRKKIGEAGKRIRCIKNVGYCFR